MGPLIVPWPSIGEYNAAFANAGTTLLPPSLSGAKAKLGPFGAPMPLSGGFAYIYEVILPNGSRKAIRCFNEDNPARQARTRDACARLKAAIAAFPELKRHFADAVWEETCVLAGQTTVPAMVMDWVEGQTLGQYIEARHADAGAITALREKLFALVRDLGRFGIVHGDLQTGNIIITTPGDAMLLDYDGLGFAGHEEGVELESGHVNFQHPAWDGSSLPALKDRFPSIAIDLGLAALAENPALFRKFSTGENILFTRDDYLAPDESAAFAAIRGIPPLSHAAELFAGLCSGRVEYLPTLDGFRDAAYRFLQPAEPLREQTHGKATRREKGPYAGQYAVFGGTDFSGIMAVVGKKIEVVGKIVEVKADGITKYGKPFAFVNFGDWRRSEFKLTIWSEGLETFAEEPDDSWEGRWVSAVGLVDEPYRKEGSGSTQLSITIQDSSQIRFISESESRYRLGGTAARKSPAPAHSPETTFQYASRATTTPRSASGKLTNAELLARLPTAAPKPAQSNTPVPSSPYNPPVQVPPDGSAFGRLIAWGIVILIIMAILGVF